MKAIVCTKYDSPDVLKLIEEDKIKTVIDRRYPLIRVPKLIDTSKKYKKKGNIVIAISKITL
jgi:D-arabinose 1-dehydrogenase-like Zn-dependent alcohol dehydrogenase